MASLEYHNELNYISSLGKRPLKGNGGLVKVPYNDMDAVT